MAKYQCPHCKKLHPRIVDICPQTNLIIPETYRLTGDVIDGKYEIIKQIGEGGMGVVYKAVHLKIGRPLAVKVLHSNVQTSEDVVTRFQKEAKIAASIGHKNIVDIIDMGKHRGKLNYIVMEYIEGDSLDALISETGKLPRYEAVDIAIQILNGLLAAHSRGIIHRDLKPENLFLVVEQDGGKYVKIVDFGIARIAQEFIVSRGRSTKEGVVMGTPAYMSPEQVRGKKELDHRSDIFSVGVILYEMLTGVLPFDSENVADLYLMIISEDPLHPMNISPSIPEGLSDAVMKAMEKKQERRHEDARAFINVLAPYSSSALLEVFVPETERVDSIPPVSPAPDEEIPDSEISIDVQAVEESAPSGITPVKPHDPSPAHAESTVEEPVVEESAPSGKTPVKPHDPSPAHAESTVEEPVVKESAPSGITPVKPHDPSPAHAESTVEEPVVKESAPSGITPVKPHDPSPAQVESTVEEPVVVDGKTASPVKRIALSALVIIALLCLAGGAAYYLGSKKQGSGAAAPDKIIASEKIETPEAEKEKAETDLNTPSFWHVKLMGLPDGAGVFVNDILHPERPVLVRESSEPHAVRIEINGNIVFNEKILVRGNVEIPVSLADSGEKSSTKKTAGKKKTIGGPEKAIGGPEEKKKKKKGKIDKDYPTLSP